MKSLLVPAALLGLLSTAWAQEGKDKKGEAPREGRKEAGKLPCGKARGELFEAMKKQGLGGDDLEAYVDAHFKAKHPEGPCHCSCGHEKDPAAAPPKPAPKDGEACGKTAKQILESGPRIDENKVAEHFKRFHPKGEACHCSCAHEKEGGKPKGKGEDAPPNRGDKK